MTVFKHETIELDEELTKPTTTSPTNMITKDYAAILVNPLLNTTELIVILNVRSKLQFYDHNLKYMGLRATIKLGIEKIEWVQNMPS